MKKLRYTLFKVKIVQIEIAIKKKIILIHAHGMQNMKTIKKLLHLTSLITVL